MRERALSVRAYACGSYADGPAYVFLHGAGFSGLSFGPLCKRLRGDAFCLALDLRRHGGTEELEGTGEILARDRELALRAEEAERDASGGTEAAGPSASASRAPQASPADLLSSSSSPRSPSPLLDSGMGGMGGPSDSGSPLSVHTLVADLAAAIPKILSAYRPGAQEHSVVLFGHSLGGALACHLTAALGRGLSEGAPGPDEPSCSLRVLCLCLIDVTEVTATRALPHMASVLGKRPAAFPSRAAFLDWVVQSGTLRNREIARFSAQGMLGRGPGVRLNAELMGSRPHWAGWFRGMNCEFLQEFKGHKLLLIGGMEKLDAEHEVAHMQGRLCVEVVPGANHNLHEDNPDQAAFLISRYLRRMYLTRHLLGKTFDWRSRRPEELEREFGEIAASGRPWAGAREAGESPEGDTSGGGAGAVQGPCGLTSRGGEAVK